MIGMNQDAERITDLIIRQKAPFWIAGTVSRLQGITGLWQVLGRSEVSFEDMILLDRYYIYNRSMDLDLSILFETLFVVLKKKEAHSPDPPLARGVRRYECGE